MTPNSRPRCSHGHYCRSRRQRSSPARASSARSRAIIGEASIAAPIFDRRNVPAGAIGVAGPVERLYAKRDPRPDLVVQVRDAARAITRDLGGARF
jgi:DNA-binding IclR family transcriptional regulator